MPLHLLYTDLTRFPCDAIVLAADESLHSGGKLFDSCTRSAGADLSAQLSLLPKCLTGQSRSLKVNHPYCKYMILTAAPIWQGGSTNEAALLAECCRSSLAEAKRLNCRKIGIGLIGADYFGFPADKATDIALETLCSDPLTDELDIFLIRNGAADDESANTNKEKLAEFFAREQKRKQKKQPNELVRFLNHPRLPEARRQTKSVAFSQVFSAEQAVAPELQDRLRDLDESFQEMLFRKIDAAGMTDAECYKKANISKQVFSKIRSNPDYHPKKQTVAALAVALRLDITETRKLLEKAGFSLSNSSKFDIIFEYFIRIQHYDFFEINEALYQYDQPLIGSE